MEEIDINDLDIESLREDLTDYFGSAIFINPYAKYDMLEVSTCNIIRLINIAIENNFDLNNYLNRKKEL